MSLIELKKRPENLIVAFAEKKATDQHVGITLNYYDGGRILVRHIFDDGIFAKTDLKAGHLLDTVNGQPVKGMSTVQVLNMFSSADGEITVEAYDIGLKVASATKESVDSKVGIGLQDRSGKVIISTVAENSLFANTVIKPGLQLIAVNGTSCRGLNKTQAIVLFKELEAMTVMAMDAGLIHACVKKEAKDTKVGIGLRDIDGRIILSNIADDSLFKGTTIKPGLHLISVNKTECEGISREDAITAFKEAEGELNVLAEDIGYVTAVVTKESMDTKVGIGLKELNGHLVVTSVTEGGLFEGTDLKPGLRLVCVNNTLTKGLSKSNAITLFKEAVGKVTVIAEKVGVVSATANKDTVNTRVGIGLKTVKGFAVISRILEDGLFADSSLRIGMRVLSVNGVNCLQKDKNEIIQLFKETEGKLHVMTEEFGLIGATVMKENEDDKVGIGLKEVNGDIFISSIYETGLFAKTDLKDELRLVSVNDTSVKGMNRNEAIKLFKDARGSLTVMAEDVGTQSLIA